MSEEYRTADDGYWDAVNDMKEGWVDMSMDVTSMAEHLRATVGASEDYIKGYLTGIMEA